MMYKSGECSSCVNSSVEYTSYPCSNCSRAPQTDKRDHLQYKTGVHYSYDSKTAPNITLKY